MRRFSDAGTHDTSHALRRPASEKRQGTKSRWGIREGCGALYRKMSNERNLPIE